MKKIIGLPVFVLFLFSSIPVFATAYQISSYFSGADEYGRVNGADTQLIVTNDPGDDNDAYAAVAEWGEQYALASIQGTHSRVESIAKYQYGFTLQGASSVDLQISYNLMTELFSSNQASVTSSAEIGIYQYEPDQWGGRISNGAPVWQDKIFVQLLEPLPGVTYDQYKENASKTAAVTLPATYQWGGTYRYMIELYAYVRGEDTYRIQYQPGVYENPDAYYSAAAYADPTFTVLTPGASFTQIALTPQGSAELSGGTLDPPPKLPEPAVLSLLALGSLGLLRRARGDTNVS